MKNLILIATLFLMNGTIFGQSKVVSGNVTDENGIGLEGVKIRVKNTRIFFYSNQDGDFNFLVDNTAEGVFFYHLSYYTEQVQLDHSSAKKDTIRIQAIMKLNENMLDSIIINSERIQTVYAKKNISVIDFSFLEKGILVLYKEKSNYRVCLTNVRGKVQQELPLNFKPLELYNDFQGGLHILSKDSCYEIVNTKREIELLAYPISSYLTFLKPCVASTPSHLYFKHFTDYNKGVIYYATDKIDHQKALLHHIQDTIGVIVAQNYQDSILKDIAPPMMSTNFIFLNQSKDKMEDQFWLKTNLTKESYNPLIEMNDTLYVFDHIQNSCWVYDSEGEPLRNFKLDYTNNSKWLKRLIVDEKSNNIYTLNDLGGIVSIQSINLLNGHMKETFTIDEHSFPTKIKINQGFVYYLFNQSNGFYKLYRQRLS